MAEIDSPRSGASGARRLNDDDPAIGRTGTPSGDAAPGSAAPDDAAPGDAAYGVAQRHNLPRRRASTLPDLSGLRDEDPDGGSSRDAATTGSTPPATRTIPMAPGGSAPDATSTTGAEHSGGPDGTTGSSVAAPSAVPSGTDGTTGSSVAVPSAVPSGTDGTTGSSVAVPSAVPSGTDGTTGSSVAVPSVADGTTGDSDGGVRSVGEGVERADAAPPGGGGHEAARRAAARDQAVMAKPGLARFLQVVVALFFPIIVVAAAVRAVATSSFLWLEYHRPGFPADRFGFSLDDRMTYGSYALDYVMNFAPPRYLGGLVTPEGEPLFLASEVGHMADVKGVLGLSFAIALVLFVLAVLACVYLARRYKGGVRRALFAGAVLTLAGIAVLTVLAVLAWETFFTQVHALFFADGTWTFRVDDTLIRLFPEQFWTDSAVTVAVLVLAATLLTLVLTWPTRGRRERSMLAQESAQSRYRKALDAS
ncbi:DUF1461 domain-containing protein [Arthrobacter sp. NamB2]|uniref:DUF1461 domain-containing protein n=1 Tax=Arthrobacter sp. NamB2 TaxID=2576035 RepID=UPI001CB96C8B|nr:DUF1461 domain-containing protein [Arthrobacter sp. NamB2]